MNQTSTTLEKYVLEVTGFLVVLFSEFLDLGHGERVPLFNICCHCFCCIVPCLLFLLSLLRCQGRSLYRSCIPVSGCLNGERISHGCKNRRLDGQQRSDNVGGLRKEQHSFCLKKSG